MRTLVIDHGVPFTKVGNAWVFDDKAIAQVRRLYAEHQRKAAALGIRPRRRHKPEAVPA